MKTNQRNTTITAIKQLIPLGLIILVALAILYYSPFFVFPYTWIMLSFLSH